MKQYSDKFSLELANKLQKFTDNKDKEIFILEDTPDQGRTNYIIEVFLINLLKNETDKNFYIVCKHHLEVGKTMTLIAILLGEDLISNHKLNEMKLINGNYLHFAEARSCPPVGAGFDWQLFIDYFNDNSMRYQPLREARLFNIGQMKNRRKMHCKYIIDNQRTGSKNLIKYYLEEYSHLLPSMDLHLKKS